MMRQKFVGHSGVSGEGALARSERDVGQYFFSRWGSFFPMGLLEGPEMAFLRLRKPVGGLCFFNRATASWFAELVVL